GLGGAGLLSPRHAVGKQAGDGRPTGVVRAQHLAQEDPQRDERRKDPIDPGYADRGEGLRDEVFGEDVASMALSKSANALSGSLPELRARPRGVRAWLCFGLLSNSFVKWATAWSKGMASLLEIHPC